MPPSAGMQRSDVTNERKGSVQGRSPLGKRLDVQKLLSNVQAKNRWKKSLTVLREEEFQRIWWKMPGGPKLLQDHGQYWALGQRQSQCLMM